MKIHNIFNELNGFFSLTKLKPSYIHFAKTDISDIVRGSKEEAAAIWGNAKVKAIGRIGSIGSDTAN